LLPQNEVGSEKLFARQNEMKGKRKEEKDAKRGYRERRVEVSDEAD
jgi:hypothetical protein